jgi:hypothetical protein
MKCALIYIGTHGPQFRAHLYHFFERVLVITSVPQATGGLRVTLGNSSRLPPRKRRGNGDAGRRLNKPETQNTNQLGF